VTPFQLSTTAWISGGMPTSIEKIAKRYQRQRKVA
jgi:hypothetical protein